MPNPNQTLEHVHYRVIQGLDFCPIQSEDPFTVILQVLQLKELTIHLNISYQFPSATSMALKNALFHLPPCWQLQVTIVALSI